MLFIIVIVLVAIYFGGRHARKLNKLEYKRAKRQYKKELHEENMEALDELTKELNAKIKKLEERYGTEYVKLVSTTNKKTLKWFFIGMISLAVALIFVPALFVTFFSLFMLIFNGIQYGIKAHKIKKEKKNEL